MVYSQGRTDPQDCVSQEENIVDRESVCDPESSTEMHLLWVPMTYSLCFLKDLVTHFHTLLCLLDKFHVAHYQQKTEVIPLKFLAFTVRQIFPLVTEHSFEIHTF